MHPAEWELQAFADDDPLLANPRDVLDHVSACPVCARRIDAARRLHAAHARVLALLDRPVPAVAVDAVIARAGGGRRPHLRRAVAAGIGVLFVAAAAAAAVPGSPLRAVIRELTMPEAAPRVSRQPAAPVPRHRESGVAFAPAARVEVDFSDVQEEGSARVVIVPTGAVEVRHWGGVAAYALTARGVVVENPGSRASYEGLIPAAVARVRVRIAGREVLTKNGATVSASVRPESGNTYVIPLSASPR